MALEHLERVIDYSDDSCTSFVLVQSEAPLLLAVPLTR